VAGLFVFAVLFGFGYPVCCRAISRVDKVLEQVLRGTSDANISFSAMRRLLARMGFQERVKGSHHILTRPAVDEILNLLPKERNANHIR